MATINLQEQMAQLMSLMAKNQRMLMEDCQRDREIQEQRERLDKSRQNAQDLSTPVSFSSKEPKVNDPDTYSGQSRNHNQFITQCNLVFRVQPSWFATETVKVHYIISCLRGIALDSVQPLLTPEDIDLDKPIELLTKTAFFAYLCSSFGNPDERGTTRQKLGALKQTSTASSFFAQFRELIAILGWRDQEPIILRAIDC